MSTAEAQTHHLTFEYPDSFVIEDGAQTQGADLVLVHPTDAGFRPNLVVTSVESNAALSDASLAAMRAALAQHPGAHIVVADCWISRREDGQEYLAREIVFTYPAELSDDNGALIVVSKSIWATGTHHVHLTASASMSQWQAFSPTFNAIAASARLAASDESLAALADPTVPLDIRAASRGLPVEDLAPVIAEWRQLRSAAPSSEQASLAAASVTISRNSIESDAVFARPPLFNISARRGLRAEQLVVYAAPHGATLVATAPLHDEPLASHDLVRITKVSAERTPAAIAEWLGLQPAWIFDDGSTPLSAEQLEAHVLAPEDGGIDSVAPWSQFALVHPHGALVFALTPDNGYVQLASQDKKTYATQPFASSNVFRALVQFCRLHFETASSAPATPHPRRPWRFGNRGDRGDRN